MKKLISFVLAFLLFAGAGVAEPAVEESAPVTYEELEIYLSSLAESAVASGKVEMVPGTDGVNSAVFSGGTLLISDEQLSENSAVLGAVLSPGQADPRGLHLGDTLDELLAVYPNDNPDLYGTYYDAALYLAGEKPEATMGWILRDGQRVQQVVHCVYSWLPEGVVRCGIRYQVDQESIVGIEIFGLDSLIEEAEALESISDIAQMQEIREYFAYPKDENGALLTPFEREDLSFAGIDFLDVTPDDAAQALGKAQVDEWTKDSNGENLRLQQWEGLSLLFVYDAGKNFLRVDTLTITDDTWEGPRGVRVGDVMDSVMNRFRHGEGGAAENGVILYGDGQNAPFGVLAYGDQTATITYSLALDEEKTVIWHLTFADAQLQSMRMLLR